MSPKEEAKELVGRMKTAIYYHMTPTDAKRCAIVSVEFARKNELNSYGYNKHLDEVKSELEKL